MASEQVEKLTHSFRNLTAAISASSTETAANQIMLKKLAQEYASVNEYINPDQLDFAYGGTYIGQNLALGLDLERQKKDLDIYSDALKTAGDNMREAEKNGYEEEYEAARKAYDEMADLVSTKLAEYAAARVKYYTTSMANVKSYYDSLISLQESYVSRYSSQLAVLEELGYRLTRNNTIVSDTVGITEILNSSLVRVEESFEKEADVLEDAGEEVRIYNDSLDNARKNTVALEEEVAEITGMFEEFAEVFEEAGATVEEISVMEELRDEIVTADAEFRRLIADTSVFKEETSTMANEMTSTIADINNQRKAMEANTRTLEEMSAMTQMYNDLSNRIATGNIIESEPFDNFDLIIDNVEERLKTVNDAFDSTAANEISAMTEMHNALSNRIVTGNVTESNPFGDMSRFIDDVENRIRTANDAFDSMNTTIERNQAMREYEAALANLDEEMRSNFQTDQAYIDITNEVSRNVANVMDAFNAFRGSIGETTNDLSTIEQEIANNISAVSMFQQELSLLYETTTDFQEELEPLEEILGVVEDRFLNVSNSTTVFYEVTEEALNNIREESSVITELDAKLQGILKTYADASKATNYYEKSAEAQREEQKMLAHSILEQEMLLADLAAETGTNTEEYRQARIELNQMRNQYDDLTISIDKTKDAEREAFYIRPIEQMIEKLQTLRGNLSSIMSLVDSEGFINKQGEYTELGIANIANQVLSYELSLKELEKAQEEYYTL